YLAACQFYYSMKNEQSVISVTPAPKEIGQEKGLVSRLPLLQFSLRRLELLFMRTVKVRRAFNKRKGQGQCKIAN
ncbi:interleukin enhancer-binding factor 3-like X15, partial [Biomphalaria glabrata]